MGAGWLRLAIGNASWARQCGGHHPSGLHSNRLDPEALPVAPVVSCTQAVAALCRGALSVCVYTGLSADCCKPLLLVHPHCRTWQPSLAAPCWASMPCSMPPAPAFPATAPFTVGRDWLCCMASSPTRLREPLAGCLWRCPLLSKVPAHAAPPLCIELHSATYFLPANCWPHHFTSLHFPSRRWRRRPENDVWCVPAEGLRGARQQGHLRRRAGGACCCCRRCAQQRWSKLHGSIRLTAEQHSRGHRNRHTRLADPPTTHPVSHHRQVMIIPEEEKDIAISVPTIVSVNVRPAPLHLADGMQLSAAAAGRWRCTAAVSGRPLGALFAAPLCANCRMAAFATYLACLATYLASVPAGHCDRGERCI